MVVEWGLYIVQQDHNGSQDQYMLLLGAFHGHTLVEAMQGRAESTSVPHHGDQMKRFVYESKEPILYTLYTCRVLLQDLAIMLWTTLILYPKLLWIRRSRASIGDSWIGIEIYTTTKLWPTRKPRAASLQQMSSHPWTTKVMQIKKTLVHKWWDYCTWEARYISQHQFLSGFKLCRNPLATAIGTNNRFGSVYGSRDVDRVEPKVDIAMNWFHSSTPLGCGSI